jgi:hypothetical protein
MVLTPNDLFSWNNKYSKYMITMSHIHYNEFIPHLPAMHVNSLCACWHSEAVKESSSSSSRRLLISLWITSPLFLCPELTDAPCPHYGGSVPPLPQYGALIHRVRTHSLLRVQDSTVTQDAPRELVSWMFSPLPLLVS